MTLQKQNVTIPVNSQLDTKSDPFLTDASSALVQENVRFYQTGALLKRNGFGKIDSGLSAYSGTLRRLHSDGKKMFLSGNAKQSDALAWSPSRSRWEGLNNQSVVAESSPLYRYISPCDISLIEDLGGFSGVQSAWFDSFEGETLVYVRDGGKNQVYLIDEATGSRRELVSSLLSQTAISQACCYILKVAGTKTYCVAGLTTGAPGSLTVVTFDQNFVESGFSDTNFIALTSVACDVHSSREKALITWRSAANTARVIEVSPTAVIQSTNYTFPAPTTDIAGSRPAIKYGLNSVFISYHQSSPTPGPHRLVRLDSSLVFQWITDGATADTSTPAYSSIAITDTEILFCSEFQDASTKSVNIDTRDYSNSVATSSVVEFSGILADAFYSDGTAYVPIYTFPKSADVPFKTAEIMAIPRDGSVPVAVPRVSGVFLYDQVRVIPPLNTVKSLSSIKIGAARALRADVQAGLRFDGASIISAQDATITAGVSLFGIDPQCKQLTGSDISLGESFLQLYGAGTYYDGLQRGLVGTGFRPVILSATGSSSGGTITAGTYRYQVNFEFYDSSGKLILSQVSAQKQVTTSGSTSSVTITVANSFALGHTTMRCVIYRTKNAGSTYLKVGEVFSNDDLSTFTSNFVFVDTLPDSAISSSARLIYTTGGVLENDVCPPAIQATIHNDRVFVVSADTRNTIYYSKKVIKGEIVSFSQFLFINSFSGNPTSDTNITGVASVGDKLLIFREESVYWISGDGANELGEGSTFNEPERLSMDIGCISPRSIIETPVGVFFRSRKGIYFVSNALQVDYVGAPVEAFNSEQVIRAKLDRTRNIISFVTPLRIMTYDYLMQRWSVDAISSVVDATYFNNKLVLIKSEMISMESSNFIDDFGESTPPPVSIKLETGWMKMTGIQDFSRAFRMLVLGRYHSAHTLTVKVYYDYDTSYVETYTITPDPAQGIYQFKIHLKKQKCQSLKVELFDTGTGRSLDLIGLTLEVGIKKGTAKINTARQY